MRKRQRDRCERKTEGWMIEKYSTGGWMIEKYSTEGWM
jgi:hypothetical protein